MTTVQAPESNILIYQQSDGNIKIDIRLEDEMLWLVYVQLCLLFNKSKATIKGFLKVQTEAKT